MRLSPNTQRNLKRILPFGGFWLVFGLVYALLEKGILGDLHYYPSTGNPYSFRGSIAIFLIMVSVTGLLVGSFEVLYLSRQFVNRNLFQKIVFKTLIYLLIIVTFLLISAAITNSYEYRLQFLAPRFWEV